MTRHRAYYQDIEKLEIIKSRILAYEKWWWRLLLITWRRPENTWRCSGVSKTWIPYWVYSSDLIFPTLDNNKRRGGQETRVIISRRIWKGGFRKPTLQNSIQQICLTPAVNLYLHYYFIERNKSNLFLKLYRSSLREWIWIRLKWKSYSWTTWISK